MVQYVSYDRWEAEHAALVERVFNLEQHYDKLRGAEQEHTAIRDRIAALEQAGRNHVAGTRTRWDRIWLMGLAVLSGIVFPILAGALIAWAHLGM